MNRKGKAERGTVLRREMQRQSNEPFGKAMKQF